MPTSMPRRRRVIAYGLYLLLCAELCAKLALLTPWARARLPAGSELGWRARWVGRYLFTDRTIFYGFDVYDPAKGWALRPGLRGDRQLPGGAVSSNSRGVRGRAEHEPGRVPGRRRIVVVGDSFTFGEGVADDETYPSRLQELLGPDTDVVNLGVHGYGHDQMLVHLREEGLRYAPDLVLLGFYADDSERNELRFRDYAKPRFRLRNGVLALEGSPVPPPARVLLRECLRSHLLDLLALGLSRLREPDPRARRMLTEALLDEIRRASESAGARFALVDLPAVDEIALVPAVGRSEAELLEYASRRGLLVCRTRAELARLPLTGVRARPGGHYDATRQAAVARAVAGCLDAAGLASHEILGAARAR
jgi:hypothetical protein